MNTLFSLQDKVVLVTGASGGLGSAIVDTMAAYGAKVIASDRTNQYVAKNGVVFIGFVKIRN
jgi:3-oxoacyl-[acyl-carrier protein] reductase